MERDNFFTNSINRVNKTGELLLPRKSTRKFLLHLGLVASLAIPVGHNLIDYASSPLERAVNRQGDKVGKKVDDMHTSADEKLQAIYDYAKSMHEGWDQVQCDLKKMGLKIDLVPSNCVIPPGEIEKTPTLNNALKP